MSGSPSIARRAQALLVAVAVALIGGVVAGPLASVARAAEPVAPPPLPQTVSADGLPTVQIDGVAWHQVIVGDTVYVAGSFANARPAGAAAGTNLIPRANMLAYNIRTGVLVPTFNPVFNNEVKRLAVSPDGKKLYAVGPFTQVNGQTRNRVAVFDLPGATLSSFAPSVNSVVQSVAATNTTLYLGGYFGSVNNVYRPRVAAVSVATGAVLPFAPQVDDRQVQAIVVAPDEKSVIIGGNFTAVAGSSSPGYGLARLDATTGVAMDLPINTEARNAGDQAGIISLATDGTNFYGSGWVYGQGGNIEGSFSGNWSDGSLKWVEDCHGDTYSVFPVGDVVYTASHKHYCGNSGGFPQTNPWNFYHSTAFTADVRGTNTPDIYGYPDHRGKPRPELLSWFPTTDVGTYTGKSQAAWTVTGNSEYVVYGGEFPKVNGVGQQGLVRYATRAAAPKKQGPRLTTTSWNPTVLSVASGKVRVSFRTNWDRDDTSLTYRVFRASETSTPLFQETIDTPFWKVLSRSVTDTGLAPGSSQRYRVTATDPNGNVGKSDWITVTVSDAPPSAYADAVDADAPTSFWRLGEPSGPTAVDWSGSSDLTLTGGYTRAVAGATAGDTATKFDGVNAFGVTDTAIEGPNVFSVEAWFRTTSKAGGKIISFGDRRTGTSGNYDRHIYMDPQGRVYFGVYNNASYTVNTSNALNDGAWHHAVGTMGAGGVTLYVDGTRVGTNTGTTVAQPYNGYWRVGGDSAWSGNPYFAGDIDDAAVYPSVLTRTQVQSHYTASGRTVSQPPRPTDAYGKAVYDAEPDLYWRLGESSGNTAADVTPNGNDGSYSGGPTLGVSGGIAGTSNTGVRFDGVNDFVASSRSWTSPQTYSLQLWFNTTTTRGGKLVGFGDSRNGTSGSYDRHVYMMDDGRLRFGVWTGQENTIDTTRSFNDGAWHQMVATQGADGMRLYVDGALVGTNAQTQAQPYSGYWRVGGDTTWGGSSGPYFAGVIDEAAVYGTVLSADTVRAAYVAGGGTVANQDPTAVFTSSSAGLRASFDAADSTDPDGSISTYAWTFGDGGSGSGAQPNHTYALAGTYQVGLTVTDNRGGTNTLTKAVSVTNTPPAASFTAVSDNLDLALDATASTDVDGTISAYQWDLGDGRTRTGSKVNVTYATAGTYAVVLTVTDNAAGTDTTSKSVTVTAANQLPTAAFTHTVSGVEASFDASGSTDPDGTVDDYAWDFGDGQNGSGQSATHTYGGSGTYAVSLTVTDNRSGTSTVTHQVSVVAPNKAPTARIAATIDGLGVDLDGSASSDPDGSISAYDWDLGDGRSSTVVSPSITYSDPGTYLVTLTVTDDGGAKDTATRSVVVDNPVFANDHFTRTAASSWGTAVTGGPWTLSGGASNFSVDGSTGRAALGAAGSNSKALLGSVSRRDLEVRGTISTDKIGNGGGTFVSLAARSGAFNSAYLGKVWVKSTGAVGLIITGLQSSETTVAQVNVAGITVAPGDQLAVRFQVTGSAPTTLRAKVWKVGTSEPATWQATGTNSIAELQDAGGVGIFAALSGSATTGRSVIGLDDFWAGPIGSTP